MSASGERVPRAEEDVASAGVAISRRDASPPVGCGMTPDSVLRLQRVVGNRAAVQVLQRELALEQPVRDPREARFTDEQMRAALRYDRTVLTDQQEIAVLRDVLGIDRDPPVVDEDFVNALLSYQGSFGLSQDGELGPRSAAVLARELTAEADAAGDPPSGTQLRRIARRLRLRALVARPSGSGALGFQGFVGSDNTPEGIVTVRINDGVNGINNMISLEYSGENADDVDWLQFESIMMFANAADGSRVYNRRTVATTGGDITLSDDSHANWIVDAVPGTSAFYMASGGAGGRARGRAVAMFDDPGGGATVEHEAFAHGAASGAASVTTRYQYFTYAVRGERARYAVHWTATTNYDTARRSESDPVYSVVGAGPVPGLRPEHMRALADKYPGDHVD